MHAKDGPAAFFEAMSGAFADTIDSRQGKEDLIGALCAQSFELFDKNVTIQAKGLPKPACKGECAACCCLRVVVTAPEVFLIARFVEVNGYRFRDRGVDLPRRISDAAVSVGGLSERQRMAARCQCPLIENDLCLAYRLRPLACRGHAVFNPEVCVDAVAGKDVEAAVSAPHLVVRSLVQSAMMSALRASGLAWGLYELNRALRLALSDRGALQKWLKGEDPLAAAAIVEFDL